MDGKKKIYHGGKTLAVTVTRDAALVALMAAALIGALLALTAGICACRKNAGKQDLMGRDTVFAEWNNFSKKKTVPPRGSEEALPVTKNPMATKSSTRSSKEKEADAAL